MTLKLKNKVIKLIKEGKSLNSISQTLGIGKTTIYYHMRKIKGKRYKPIILKENNLELVGEVLGLFAGDGCLTNQPERWDYRVRFFLNINETSIIRKYSNSILELIGKSPTRFNTCSVTILQITSKDFCKFIKNYLKFEKNKAKTVELKNKNLLKNKNFVKGFVRGLIDSEGYVRKNRKEIYFGSISKRLVSDFIFGIGNWSIPYKEYVQRKGRLNDFHKVRISSEAVDKFNEIIKPIKAV